MRWNPELPLAVLCLVLASCSREKLACDEVLVFPVNDEGRTTLCVWTALEGVGEGVSLEVTAPGGMAWTFVPRVEEVDGVPYYGSSSLELPMTESGTYRVRVLRKDGNLVEAEAAVPSAPYPSLPAITATGRTFRWTDGWTLRWNAFDKAGSVLGSGTAAGELTVDEGAERVVFTLYDPLMKRAVRKSFSCT